ncbi:ParB/RepB/Spo0J family partition protein [Candidatus Gracilibacteria bacterium]|nr:ParB/RepB/Spo0J family partition protein [Candidatus Gracilibacteria bacterium]NJM86120.1 ParB/RepB/Spo0J family partition protein [Hydrococcus sp. RU_2_2]NJP20476.1 ParB/RepB/Spo0J family partition protein [Hydrococcus sp. CRU_1_1]NJQ96556.1 ParB/RepB/Spo0J family partition protein [Hydrococcus sp. CSU_1_8]
MSRSKRDKPFSGNLTTPQPGWLSSDEADSEKSSESLVKLSEIHLPSQQPRHYFDEHALKQLADSISQHGILQPLLVRPLEKGGYELVAGERRYRAATEVGLTEVPVVVKELADEAAWQLALIENLQREDLNPVEETEGILQLLAFKLEMPVEEISPLLHRLQKAPKDEALRTANNVIVKKEANETESSNNVIGKSKRRKNSPANNVTSEREEAPSSELVLIEAVFRDLGLMTWESFVNNRLPLLNLPQDITEALRQGKIAYTKAKAIAQIKDENQRTALLKEALAQQLSLSQIKEKIGSLQSKPKSEIPEVPERLKVAYQKLKKTRIWENPKKCKQIETLLTKLEALLEETS